MRVAAESPGVDYVAQGCRIPTSWSSSRFMRVAGPKKGPDCLFGVVPGRRYNYQALQLSYSRHNETATTSNTPTATLRYPAPASELCTQRTDLSHAGENHLGSCARIFDVRRHTTYAFVKLSGPQPGPVRTRTCELSVHFHIQNLHTHTRRHTHELSASINHAPTVTKHTSYTHTLAQTARKPHACNARPHTHPEPT